MSIGAEDVLRVARLAALEVDPAESAALAAELDRIVAYIGQLQALGGAAGAPAFHPGPPAAPLRPDRVDPLPLARPPAEIAPDFADGFFLVPRLPAMEPE